MNFSSRRLFSLLCLVLALTGCAELRGRRHAREGNRLFLEGDYAKAAAEYSAAEQLLPSLNVITLNHGLACRQLMVPGAKGPAQEEAIRCALEAFSRLKKSQPADPRGEQLYLQTLFDAERFDDLVAHYQEQLKNAPQNLEAINALIQIYSRRERWDDALHWTQRRAEIAQRDAEAQYTVGVFIWNRLFQRGGHGERATYNPSGDVAATPPPPFNEGDIVGEERVRLADLGIAYLEKALALRPNYREAMTYLNLIYRQKSYAYFAQPEQWRINLEQAMAWQKKALAANGTSNNPPAGAQQ